MNSVATLFMLINSFTAQVQAGVHLAQCELINSVATIDRNAARSVKFQF